MTPDTPPKPVSNFKSWAIGCLLISLTGVMMDFFQVGFILEEELGLNWLFQIRGVRPHPEEVVIVSTDRQSAYELGLPQEPYKWPRSLHGKLVSRLSEQGAKVIVFDLFFKDIGSQEENAPFAEAMRQAGNVILFEKLTTAGSQAHPVRGSIRIPPTVQLAQAAAGLASHPLPTGALRVNQFWLFDPNNPYRATLPFLALQLNALDLYEKLLELLREMVPTEVTALPQRPHDIQGPDGIQHVVKNLRTIFRRHPTLGETLLGKLPIPRSDQQMKNHRLLESLIWAYNQEDSQFIDFYGPPRTVLTIPYFCVLIPCSSQRLGRPSPVDFSGKVVFVGLSETTQSEQQDRFPTIFTSEEGLDLSGVEIAATTFANLLERHHVSPLPLYLHLFVLLFWGILVGTAFFLVSTTRLQHQSGLLIAALSGLGIGLGMVYFGVVVWVFITQALWFPLVVPLLIQLPVGLFAALFGNFHEVNRQRLTTEKALADYVPAPVIKPLARRIAEIQSQGQVVQGLCLFTDAEGYTKVSEALEGNPGKLQVLMNRYFETICAPVRAQEGIVSDITGDSVLAIWPAGMLTLKLRTTVCMAALDLISAVARFNRSEPDYSLPTRVGISGGPMFTGTVGAGEFYTYTPVGDIVNTASRIENLNKKLGTHVLATQLVAQDLPDVFTRKVGSFQLIGKTRPVVIYELLGRKSEADGICREAIQLFSYGVEFFHARSWDQAEESFRACLQLRGEDGPSHFYLRLCSHYRNHPPSQDWQGTIILTTK
ncbi:MAG: adenylate/guanylate cyclase domain-containing protein [Nitrospira sp.]|nr:adenylate/guanylate cyclase domain-containing protein [Nitrospira sp.]